jgi:betaine-aldehyde dehydrogenase
MVSDAEQTRSHGLGTAETVIALEPMVIGGESVHAASGETFVIQAPATGRHLAEVPRSGVEDVARATSAAALAMAGWRALPATVRGRKLCQVADDLEAELEQVAQLLASETGNAIRLQSRPEVQSAVDLLRYFGGAAGEGKGETVPLGGGLLNYTVREPVGVVGAMTPWNAPLQLAVVKVAAAIALGNTVVLKASEEAPLAVLRFAHIANRHLPEGVLNVVTGLGPEAGAALIAEPGIHKLSFTGSTAVGRLVMAAAAERTAPVSLELGGKSPSIVFPDADDDVTAEGIVNSMRFPRQGQSCTAGTRLYIHESVFESVLTKVVTRLAELVLGDPNDEATDVGSIINQRQHDRVRGYVEEAVALGATAVCGGKDAHLGPALANGHFFEPTVLAAVDPEWRVARDEIFGPVLVAIPWSTESDAIRMANSSAYGLAAYVWSRDISTAIRTADALEAGWVQVNRGLGQLPGMSYGGTKSSGIGREFSIEGALEAFTHRKTITIAL